MLVRRLLGSNSYSSTKSLLQSMKTYSGHSQNENTSFKPDDQLLQEVPVSKNVDKEQAAEIVETLKYSVDEERFYIPLPNVSISEFTDKKHTAASLEDLKDDGRDYSIATNRF